MHLETKVIHSSFSPDPVINTVAKPLTQTIEFRSNSPPHGFELFHLTVPGNTYTHVTNPTYEMLESRMADLEGGLGGLAVASGMDAIKYAVQAITEEGSNIVAINGLSGDTYQFFAHTLAQQGIEARFVPHDKIDELAARIDDKTALVFCEAVSPHSHICDITEIASIAHAHENGVPLIVDNTIPTPYLWRPIEHGADIIIHALTTYIGGHGTTIGGMIIDSGNFPWVDHAKRFPMLTTPDQSYHNEVYTETLGDAAFIGRCRVMPLRNTSAALSPVSAFLLLQGLETLPLRMDRHCENALKIAEYLEQHEVVNWVHYAGLPTSKYHSLAQKYMGGRASGILNFGLKGGFYATNRLLNSLQLFIQLTHIGDAKSLATHPESTTHSLLNKTELAAFGVSPDMVRLSVGIEHIDDLIEDLEQALIISQQ